MARRTIAYSCPFVPAEWIAAHGLIPSRVMPRSAAAGNRLADLPDAFPAMGVCPYAKAFLAEMATCHEAAALIMTTTCDQMRRISELAAEQVDIPLFLMHVPASCGTSAAHALYREELRRLGAFLCRVGGTSPDPGQLATAMRQYDSRRAALRAAQSACTPRQFSDAIVHFHKTGEVLSYSGFVPFRGKRLALVGGPMTQERMVIFDLVESAGGCVVLDATETGERTLPAPFSRRRLAEDPFMELTDAYFGAIPDAFRRPNDHLYEWLRREILSRDVRAILFLSYTWCDTWQAELNRMKEWTVLPILALDSDGGDPAENVRTLSRIQAFLEMIP